MVKLVDFGLTKSSLALRLLSGERIPALPAGGGVGPELAAICARALELDPDDRYQTAADFQAALSRTLPARAAASTARRLAKVVDRAFAQQREAVQEQIRLNTDEVDDGDFLLTDEGDELEYVVEGTAEPPPLPAAATPADPPGDASHHPAP